MAADNFDPCAHRVELLNALRDLHNNLSALGATPLVSMAAAKTYDDAGLRQVLIITRNQLIGIAKAIEEND